MVEDTTLAMPCMIFFIFGFVSGRFRERVRLVDTRGLFIVSSKRVLRKRVVQLVERGLRAGGRSLENKIALVSQTFLSVLRPNVRDAAFGGIVFQMKLGPEPRLFVRIGKARNENRVPRQLGLVCRPQSPRLHRNGILFQQRFGSEMNCARIVRAAKQHLFENGAKKTKTNKIPARELT